MDSASVLLHGIRVGRLDRLDEIVQDYVFEFEPAWLEDPRRPTLGQLFLERLPDPIRSSGLPCWFDHLLPQGTSRRLFHRIVGLDETESDSFDLLLAIGGDLPGAVVVRPMTPQLFGPFDLDASFDDIPDGRGFSLPGTQNKLSIREGEGGLVIPARDQQGTWIAKFDSPSFPGLPTLEHATTRWARRSGIRAHEARLASVDEFVNLPEGLPLGDGQVFLAARFDRAGEGRVHAEDFGQILDIPAGDQQYSSNYEDIAKILMVLTPEDIREYIERLAFMVVSGNGDAHIKNWGVVYPDRRTPRLGPAYDLVSTVARLPRDDLALSLGATRDFAELRVESFARMARIAQRTEAEVFRWVRDIRDRAFDVWTREAEALGFSEHDRRGIDQHIARLSFCQSNP